MTTSEIDEIINSLNNDKFNVIYEILGIKKHNYLEDFVKAHYTDFINKIVDSIKKENLQYFLSMLYKVKSSRDKCIMLKRIGDVNYIKSIISDKNMLKKLKLDTYDTAELIAATGDIDYIKQFLENDDLINEYKFFASDYYKLIIATNDVKYIEDIWSSEEKLLKYKLAGYYIIELVISTHDSEFIKKIVKEERKRKRYNCSNYDMYKLITATHDSKYIKDILQDEDQLRKYGLYSFIDRCFNPLKIKSLVCAAKDDYKFIESIITDKEKLKRFCLKSDDVADILVECFDRSYIINIINKKEKIDKYSLNIDSVIKLIINCYSKEQLEHLINNADTSKKYGIPDEQFIKLVLATKSKDLITNFLEKNKDESDRQYKEYIDLPDNMTFGIEIESVGENSQFIKDLNMLLVDDWLCKEDMSISKGVEVISPILTGDNKKSSYDIRNVCQILKKLRSRSIFKVCRAYTYWSRLLNYKKELAIFSRDLVQFGNGFLCNEQQGGGNT